MFINVLPSSFVIISSTKHAIIEIIEQLMGQFKDDKMNGKGEMRYADGQVKEGIWSNNEFIG